MFVVAGPQRFQCRQHFLHVPIGIGLLQSIVHAIEFALVGTRAYAKLQSSAADQIGKRGFTGEIDRMPVGSHRASGSEAYIVGMLRPPGEYLKGVGRNRHFQCMVLRGPDNVEAGLIGHLHHFQRMLHDIVHVGAFVHAL